MDGEKVLRNSCTTTGGYPRSRTSSRYPGLLGLAWAGNKRATYYEAREAALHSLLGMATRRWSRHFSLLSIVTEREDD